MKPLVRIFANIPYGDKTKIINDKEGSKEYKQSDYPMFPFYRRQKTETDYKDVEIIGGTFHAHHHGIATYGDARKGIAFDREKQQFPKTYSRLDCEKDSEMYNIIYYSRQF